MKRTIILLAAAIALWAQTAQGQGWQPTTWPPAPAPGCGTYVPVPAGTPDICGGIAEMQAASQAFDYSMANGANVETASQYAQQQRQQWNRETGRYDSEAWMWQPAPQNQAQWDQRRRQGGR
jgi:hypothetical protein